ncbi:sensor histidine kinase [Pontibacter russatus]|uniref:sensor histidine kinase n=1 Tax=Pontibacter russatus TaxID=2694929 RepID=UPI00192A41D0|nr:HAMP domain-containing sensor histidine kinase [Pontibacter russatus]
MSNIKGLHNLYRAEPTTETASEVMGKIDQMVDNMSVTIQDLNLILNMALGQQLSREKVNLVDLTEKQLQNLQANIMLRNAKIEQDLQVRELLAPKVYMESILHNLLSNALKYSADDRTPLIRIGTWQQGPHLYLRVSDNGMGMDMAKVGNKLFGLYKTFHRNRDSKGMGLYLTKMQVESLGGEIAVESVPDRGTTFTVKLPVARE